MLKRENYTSEHIDALRKQTGADPSILERTVFAFGLLEALCRVKMPFIFKGGTSLLILLDEPRRLSTDMKRDKLHPIRKDAKYKLFLKSEIMQRRKQQ